MSSSGHLLGTVFGGGSSAMEQRRLIIQHVASQKNQMEGVILQEADTFKDEVRKLRDMFINNSNLFLQMIKRLKSSGGRPVQVIELFQESVNCVLWRIVTGRPVEADKRLELTQAIRTLFEFTSGKPLQSLQVCVEEVSVKS